MKKIIFAAIFTASVFVLSAQRFEIRILERGTQAHVQMRSVSESTPTTKEHFTDIVFGVIWTNRKITDLNIASTDFGITKSGTVQEHKGFYYQAFGAMGTPLQPPFNWKQNEWEDIAILDVEGGSQWGFYFQKQLKIALSGYDMTTDPNVGFQLVDQTPRVQNYDFSYHIKDFEAQPHEAQSAVINWSAEEHELLDHYVVERSRDGKSWRHAGYVDRNERHPQYEFLDTRLEGVRSGVYYRLRVEDKFGGFSYSDKDFVPFKVSVEVYPNPSVNGLHIEIDKNGMVKPDQLVIYDVQGRLIYRQDIPAGSYEEHIDYSKAGLEGGAYILEFRKDDEVYWNEKFEIMGRS